MSNIARKKGREGSTGPKYVKMCQKFPYFWCQKRDPQNAFFLLSTGTIIATNTVTRVVIRHIREGFYRLGTVNVAINVPVDNKKNAFFGVPFEGIIWHNFSLFCPQNLYKKGN